MSDDKPPEPTTKPIPQGEILSGLVTKLAATIDRIESKQDQGFVAVKADFLLLTGQFEGLERDVRGMQSWRVRVDDKLTRHSERAKNPSEMDLDLQAKQAIEIIKNAEQDKKLGETHAMAEAAVLKLEDMEKAATARARVLDGIASTVNAALKSAPMAKIATGVLYALGGFLIAVLGYYAKKYGAP